jgi:hypothetical protein
VIQKCCSGDIDCLETSDWNVFKTTTEDNVKSMNDSYARLILVFNFHF